MKKLSPLLTPLLLFAPFFSYAAPLETFEVSSLSGTSTQTSTVLENGKKYIVEVSGTYTYAPGGRIADAEFVYSPDDADWFEEIPAPYPDKALLLELLVNNSTQDWLGSTDDENFTPHTYSPNHVYRLEVIGTGNPLSFSIYDSSYDWNEGSLTVSIALAQPETKQQCKKGGWQDYGFKNQGACVSFLQSNENAKNK